MRPLAGTIANCYSQQMGLQVLYARAALKTLRALSKQEAQAIMAKIDAYAAEPRGNHPWARQLSGVEGLRIRQGDYRAICRIESDSLVIVAIGHRSSVYR